jgi:hypothetical protein
MCRGMLASAGSLNGHDFQAANGGRSPRFKSHLYWIEDETAASHRVNRATGALWRSRLVTTGAPRPMKTGTTASLCFYDTAAGAESRSAKLRLLATLHYTSSFDRVARSGYPSTAGLSIRPQNRRDGPIPAVTPNGAVGLPRVTLLDTLRLIVRSLLPFV